MLILAGVQYPLNFFFVLFDKSRDADDVDDGAVIFYFVLFCLFL